MSDTVAIGDIISIGSLGMLTAVYESNITAIEQAIVAILTGDTVVNSIIDNRIFPMVIPQGQEIPAITYQQISGVRDHTFSEDDGLPECRYQLNCWADTYSEAKTLSRYVMKALDSYSGTVGDCVVRAIFIEDEGDIISMQPEKQVIKRYGKRLDIKVWYNESI